MKTLTDVLKNKNITKTTVAEGLGISLTNMGRYDDLSKRSLDDLKRIADIIGMSLSELITSAVGTNVSISGNSGIANTGYIGGSAVSNNNVNIILPQEGYVKIINHIGEESTQLATSLCNSEETQIRIKSLEKEVKDLTLKLYETQKELIDTLKSK